MGTDIGIIATENKDLAICLKYHGTLDYVSAFLAYASMFGAPSPEHKTNVNGIEESSGWLSLSKIISNYLDKHCGGLSHISYTACINTYDAMHDWADGDHGVYIVKDWKIARREGNYILPDCWIEPIEPLTKLMIDIDKAQPFPVGNWIIHEFVKKYGARYIESIKNAIVVR